MLCAAGAAAAALRPSALFFGLQRTDLAPRAIFVPAVTLAAATRAFGRVGRPGVAAGALPGLLNAGFAGLR